MLTLSSPLALVPDAMHGCVSWGDLLRSLGPHLEGYDAQAHGLDSEPGLGPGLARGSGPGVEVEEGDEVVVGVNLMGGKDEDEDEDAEEEVEEDEVEEEEEEDGSDEGFADVPTSSESQGQGLGTGLGPGQELGQGRGSGPVETSQIPDKPTTSTSFLPLGPDSSPSPSPGPDPTAGPNSSPGMLARIAQTLSWSAQPQTQTPQTPQAQSSPPTQTQLSPLTTTALASHNTDLPPRPALPNPSHRISYNTMVDSDNQSNPDQSNHDQSNHDQSNLNDRASVGSRGSQVGTPLRTITVTK